VGVDRGSREAISQIYVRTRPGETEAGNGSDLDDGRQATLPGLTRLDNVVRLRLADSTARIDRLDRQRMAAIRANVAPGYALGDRI